MKHLSVRDAVGMVLCHDVTRIVPGEYKGPAFKKGHIIGLPGCVMYHRASIFDLIVPRLLAGETVTREDVIELGHGGFCSGCEICTFPCCGFGK